MSQILTRTFAADHVTPVRAYAAMRAQSAGRSSFLLESVKPGDSSARYSILGYRARSEHAYPPGAHALAMLSDDAAALENAEELAARFSQSLVGYIAYDAAHALHMIKPWPNEGLRARFMCDATVAVFDHAAHTVTIAGRSKGAVERCAWEMTHGPDLDALPLPDVNVLPESVEPNLNDAAYGMKVERAKGYISDGECSQIVLARTFTVPMRNADPFDVYRALRVLSPSPYLCFFDFAETPFAEGLQIASVAPESLIRMRGGETKPVASEGAGEVAAGVASIEALKAVFPAEMLTGAPKERAMQIIRQLEATTRNVYGGAMGYISPDGSLDMAAAVRTVVARQAEFDVTVGVTIVADSDGEKQAEENRNTAQVALAAIRSAHDAYERREAREEAKRKRLEEEERKKAEAAAKENEGAANASEGSE